MGNIFIKEKKPAVAFKKIPNHETRSAEYNDITLEQIHYEDEGKCCVCKKELTGFYIYSINYKKTIFICNRCYLIGS